MPKLENRRNIRMNEEIIVFIDEDTLTNEELEELTNDEN